MSTADKNKCKRGISLKRVLIYMLELCKQLGYIDTYEENYHLGMPGYSDQSQFKAPYHITFNDGSEWIVYTTTSLRERIKEVYWDAENLKIINNNITEAYLVYPDSLSENERHKFISKNVKIESRKEFSTLNALVSQDSFFNRIEAYALRGLNDGQIRNKKGKNFEKRIVATLNNPSNLKKWITQDEALEGLHYKIFNEILNSFELDHTKVKNINATSDKNFIGHLPSGGEAKTDVLVTITDTNNSVEYFTISCKRSSSNTVSVHQYSANTFSQVLDPTNLELKRVLNEFQKYGNKRDMKTNDVEILQNEIKKYILRLCQWAIGGIGGDGNPKTQWARYLMIYDNNLESVSIHKTDDYCEVLARDCSKTFGTPFSWTYQGTRGTNIQLKCQINL